MKKFSIIFLLLISIFVFSACKKKPVTYSAWSVETAPTLESEGTIFRTSQDGKNTKQTKTLPKLGSDYTINATTEATCFEDGEGKYVYTVDGQIFEFSGIIKAGHNFGAWEVVKTPTTEVFGEIKRVCKRDSEHFETQILPMLNPNDYEVEMVDATCEQKGCATYKISVDGQEFSFDIELPEKGHNYSENWNVLVTPTETTKGEIARVCLNDDSHFTDRREIPELSSDEYAFEVEKDATCEKSGTGYYVLTVEGKEIRVKVEIPAKGHKFGEWQLITKPTKETPGQIKRVCENDEEHVETITLPALNTFDYTYIIEVEPKCEVDGLVIYQYSVGNFQFEEVLPATGHLFGNYEVTTEPTEENQGLLTRYCNNNNEHVDTYVLPALNEVDYTVTKVEPKCEVDGKKIYSITIGGQNFEFEVAIPQTGHIYSGEWTIVEAPTQEKAGKIVKKCLNDENHQIEKLLPLLSSKNYEMTVDEDKNTTTFTITIDGQPFEFTIDGIVEVEKTEEVISQQ